MKKAASSTGNQHSHTYCNLKPKIIKTLTVLLSIFTFLRTPKLLGGMIINDFNDLLRVKY